MCRPSASSFAVSTPHGRMRRDCVHTIASGSHLQQNIDTHMLDVYHSNEYVRTIPKCKDQHLRPLFERIQAQIELTEEDTTTPSTAPVFPPDYDGWTAYTAWHSPSGIDQFLGNFSVPDAPANAPDQLYVFTGLQNFDWIPVRDPNPDGFDILQPVLQYPGDNGDYWSMKSVSEGRSERE